MSEATSKSPDLRPMIQYCVSRQSRAVCAVILLVALFAPHGWTSTDSEATQAAIADCISAAAPLKLKITEQLLLGEDVDRSASSGSDGPSTVGHCAIQRRGQNIEIRVRRPLLENRVIRLESDFDGEAGLVEWVCLGDGIPAALLPRACESVGESDPRLAILDEMAKDGDAEQQRFFEIMNEHMAANAAAVDDFNSAANAVQEAWVLDPARLTSSEEYDRQREVLEDYRKSTRAYSDFYHGMEDALRERLSVLGPSSDLAKGAMKGVRQSYEQYGGLFEPFIEAHIAYSDQLLSLLDMLWPNDGAWTLENGEVTFAETARYSAFVSLTDEIQENEALINELNASLQNIRNQGMFDRTVDRSAVSPGSAETGAPLKINLVARLPEGVDASEPFQWTVLRSGAEEMIVPGETTAEIRLDLSPGDYEVVVLHGDFTAESSFAVSVDGPSRFELLLEGQSEVFALKAPAEVTAGSPFTVHWRKPAGDRGYIFVASESLADNRYQYGSNSLEVSKATSGTLVAPAEAGLYEIRYFSRESGALVKRLPLSVKQGEVHIQFPGTVSAGSTFEFDWSGPAGPGDRIFVAAGGLSANRYYTNDDMAFRTDRVGEPRIVAPATAGEYEVRYYSGKLGAPLARFPITVTAAKVTIEAPRLVTGGTKFDVKWTGPASKGDFLFLAEPDLPAGRYYTNSSRRHKVSDGPSGQLTAPTEPGNYEIRYYSYANGTALAQRVVIVH